MERVTGLKMYRLWAILFLSFALSNLSQAKNDSKLPSAVVVGTVYCDTCSQRSFTKASHFISGAVVAVECAGTKSRPSFRKEVRTNELGEFEVHLPFSVRKHVNKIRRCSVKLVSSSEPHCAVASTATSSSLHLRSRKQGKQIFSAGFFTFRPSQQPQLCDQNPIGQSSKEINTYKSSTSTALPPNFWFPFPPFFPAPTPSPWTNGDVTVEPAALPPNFWFPFPPFSPAPTPSPWTNGDVTVEPAALPPNFWFPFPPFFPAPTPSPSTNGDVTVEPAALPPNFWFPFPPFFPAPTPSPSPSPSTNGDVTLEPAALPPNFWFPFPPFFPTPSPSPFPSTNEDVAPAPAALPPILQFPFPLPPFTFPPLPASPGLPPPPTSSK